VEILIIWRNWILKTENKKPTFYELSATDRMHWVNQAQEFVDRGYVTDKDVYELAEQMYERKLQVLNG